MYEKIEKKDCYRCMYHDRSLDNKVAKKTTKRVVSVVKDRVYEDIYRYLSTKKKKNIYRMARVRERKTRYFNQVNCTKDETKHLLVKEGGIKHR
jgi:hypothetical protein